MEAGLRLTYDLLSPKLTKRNCLQRRIVIITILVLEVSGIDIIKAYYNYTGI